MVWETIFQVLFWVALPLCLLFLNQYGRLILNLSVGIKQINPVGNLRRGDLDVNDTKKVFTVKFFWNKRTLELEFISKISAWSDDDFSNDWPNEYIEVHFKKRITIVLNATNKTHVEFVNRITNLLHVDRLNWAQGFSIGTEDNPIILFERK